MAKYATAFGLLAGLASARFGQEQVPIPAISAVNGGQPGEAPTIAGAAISDLLAGPNACNKVWRPLLIGETNLGSHSISSLEVTRFSPGSELVPTLLLQLLASSLLRRTSTPS